MSDRFVKVNDVETVESSNSTALIVLFVTVIAVVVIGMMFWQPWATATPQSSTTTIIHDGQTKAPDNRPIIINQPAAAAPGNTKIDIHNDVPKQDAASTSAAGNNDAGNDDAKNAANN